MSNGRALRVANCSGFFGDRLSAAREMVDGGPIDVLTGDWLAELTMGILARQRAKHPEAGYARTFVTQLEDVLGDCLDRGIRIVSNAGGLNPAGCAAQVEAIGARLGRDVKVAVVTGDDATAAFRAAREKGWQAPHTDSGAPIASAGAEPLLANAYLGGWAIAEALAAGADVVVTGRVTDAALTMGPAAWHFGWARDDWDRLAGAVVAGHVIECGAQATGGNFSFFTEISGGNAPHGSGAESESGPRSGGDSESGGSVMAGAKTAPAITDISGMSSLARLGFPVAEIHADGSSVITKHPGTDGAVTVDTVTAQLLYEVDGPRYLGPDVVTRLDTARLEQDGPDRVRISGVRGEPPPETVKVGALIPGGWRNEGTFILTGLNIGEKASLAQAALWAHVPGGEKAFDQVTVRLLRADREDPATMEQAVALLTITVSARDQKLVAGFSRAAVETGLASYPGLHMTAPPGPGSPVIVFWPTLLPAGDFTQTVTLDGRSWNVPLTSSPAPATASSAPPAPFSSSASPPSSTAQALAPDPEISPVGVYVRDVEARSARHLVARRAPAPATPAPPAPPPPSTSAALPSPSSEAGVELDSGRVNEDPFRIPIKENPASESHPGDQGSTVRAALGSVLGARSGDKAGNATLGVWARDEAGHRWLRSWWTESRLRELLPEAAGLELRLWELPLLRACGVTVVGLLGAGVAANHALDGQAKALGEYLRAKVADIPADLVRAHGRRA